MINALNKQISCHLKLLVSLRNFPKNFTGILETPNRDKFWYLNGKCHREDGSAIETVDGTREWYINGKLHRTNGPAIEHSSGSKIWWLNGKRHRTNGPAVEYTNGYKEWYLNGNKYLEKDWKEAVEIFFK